MAVLVDRNTRVIVQGITGKSGILQTKSLIDYGTAVVAGVTPGKAGTAVEGVPVFNSVADAMKETDPNAAISFVPPLFAKDAAMEAMELVSSCSCSPWKGSPSTTFLISCPMLQGGVRVLGPGQPASSRENASSALIPPACQEGRSGVSKAAPFYRWKNPDRCRHSPVHVVALGGPIWGTPRDVLSFLTLIPRRR